MKSVIFKNKKNEIISSPNLYEDPTEFVNSIVSTNYFGKPERWIVKDSEEYDLSDVLETEDRVNELTQESTTWVKLKAEYTIEIEDITDKLQKESRIAELRKLLSESDFRMTTDYFKRMSIEDQTHWDQTRESWRQELRSLGV